MQNSDLYTPRMQRKVEWVDVEKKLVASSRLLLRAVAAPRPVSIIVILREYGRRKLYSVAGLWRRSGFVLIETVLGTHVVFFPMNSTLTYGDSTCSYIILAVPCLIDYDSQNTGITKDNQGSLSVQNRLPHLVRSAT